MFTPPRCRVCYDKLNIHADITLGDPWHMTDVDWENGSSLIISRTDKGTALLGEAEAAGYIEFSSRSVSELLNSQKVEARRKLTQLYSHALCNIFDTKRLGILQFGYQNHSSSEYKIRMCENDLRQFIHMDKTFSKKDVVKEAWKTVKVYRRKKRKEVFIDNLKAPIRRLINIIKK